MLLVEVIRLGEQGPRLVLRCDFHAVHGKVEVVEVQAGKQIVEVVLLENNPAAEFLRNLGREVRENPMPLVLIGIGIAWLMVASSRTSRAAIASAADTVAKKAEDISSATSAAASTVGNKTAEFAGRARSVTDGLVEKARAAFEKAKPPLTAAPQGSERSISGEGVSETTQREDACAVGAVHEHR